MTKTNFPLCCYTNGELVVQGEDVSYNNGSEFFVVVDSDIKFDNLYDLICEELGVDRSKFKLEIKLKFPTYRGYKAIVLNNDKVLNVMWASVYQSNAASMELYIDLIDITPTSYVNLLNQATRGDPIDFSNDIIIGNETEWDMDVVLSDFEEDDDIVTPSAPILEFTKLYNVDPCYDGKDVVSYEQDGEFCVNQRFKDKTTLAKLVKIYHLEKSQMFFVKESNTQTVTYACNRQPISPRQASVPQDNQNLHYYTPTSADYHSLVSFHN